MSRGLGRLQRKVITALRQHGREARLDQVVALVAGRITDLGVRYPVGWTPTRSPNKYAVVRLNVDSLAPANSPMPTLPQENI